MYILNNFELIEGLHCLYSSIYNIFKYLGLSYQEHEIFFLCNGFKFKLAGENEILFDNLLEQISMDYKQQLNLLTDRLNQPLQWFSCAKESFNNFNDIYCYLKKGLPILAFLDASILKYHILENPHPNLGAHSLIIYGIDMENRCIFIADSFVTDYSNKISTYKTKISFQDFKNHFMGYAVFGYPENEINDEKIYQYCCDDLNEYNHNENIRTGHAVLNHTIKCIKYYLEEKKINNLIPLVFLLKAYFFMVLPYFGNMIEDCQANYEDLKEYLKKEIDLLKTEWLSFFMRCLSYDEKKGVCERIIESGIQVTKRQEKFINDYIIFFEEVLKSGQ